MGPIMIVENASFMRAVFKKIVLQAGHEVIAKATNGDDAIAQFHQSQPDLALIGDKISLGPKVKMTSKHQKQIVTANLATKRVMHSSKRQEALIAEVIKSGAKISW